MVTTKEEEASGDFWYLNRGCSTHMLGQREWFVDQLDESIRSRVKFTDNSTLTTPRMGKVLIQKKNGEHSFIYDVLYVPGMKSNLLSLGQLLEKGYKMDMKDRMLRVYDNSERLILKAPLSKNRTFKVGIQVLEHKCMAAAECNNDWLWQYRFAHLNFKDLILLQKHNMVTGLPQIQQPKELCEECLESKQSRSSFKPNA